MNGNDCCIVESLFSSDPTILLHCSHRSTYRLTSQIRCLGDCILRVPAFSLLVGYTHEEHEYPQFAVCHSTHLFIYKPIRHFEVRHKKSPVPVWIVSRYKARPSVATSESTQIKVIFYTSYSGIIAHPLARTDILS